MLFVEWQNALIKKICRRNRCLVGVEFCMSYLAVGVYVGLLVNTTNTLQRADVECILRTKVSGVFGLNFTVSFLFFLLAFKGL